MMNKIIRYLLITNLFFTTFLSAFAVTACAKAVQFNHKSVDKELIPYVLEYKALLKEYCPNDAYNTTTMYKIELSPRLENDSWLGVCNYKINGFHIQILKSFWDRAEPEERRQLMYHELTHCLLDKDHNDDQTHYMYKYFNYVDPAMVKKQLILDIIITCNNGELNGR